jgi:hypothetical protein
MFCNKTGNPQVMAGTTILGTKTLTLTLLKNLGGKTQENTVYMSHYQPINDEQYILICTLSFMKMYLAIFNKENPWLEVWLKC